MPASIPRILFHSLTIQTIELKPNFMIKSKKFVCFSAPLAVRSLQDLTRIYIRRTLRSLITDDNAGRSTTQRPQKRKRRRFRRSRRINTYVFVGNQLIPRPMDSEDDECIEEESKDEELEKDIEPVKPEEPQVNHLRDKILSLPLPESLKAYLLFYREK